MEKRKTALMVAVAVVLTMCVGIVPAWAYFTSNDRAAGGEDINVEPTTVPHETFGNRTKQVTITNTGESAVFVRARAYGSPAPTVDGSAWTKDGDWYVYNSAVEPGEATEALTVTVNFPEGATEDDEYNVIVVYESTPVLYDEDGNATADWNFVLDTKTAEGGN